jgi:hypothetical protein
MILENFPSCCTLRIASQFGESYTAEGGCTQYSRQDVKDFIELALTRQRSVGHAALVVTTNNEQKMVNSILNELEFKHSSWMSKRTHSDTKVRIWWKETGE